MRIILIVAKYVRFVVETLSYHRNDAGGAALVTHWPPTRARARHQSALTRQEKNNTPIKGNVPDFQCNSNYVHELDIGKSCQEDNS